MINRNALVIGGAAVLVAASGGAAVTYLLVNHPAPEDVTVSTETLAPVVTPSKKAEPGVVLSPGDYTFNLGVAEFPVKITDCDPPKPGCLVMDVTEDPAKGVPAFNQVMTFADGQYSGQGMNAAGVVCGGQVTPAEVRYTVNNDGSDGKAVVVSSDPCGDGQPVRPQAFTLTPAGPPTG